MDAQEQKALLRKLMNVREPAPLSEDYMRAEAEYPRVEIEAKGIVWIEYLEPIGFAPDAVSPALAGQLFLWQGDYGLWQCSKLCIRRPMTMNRSFAGCSKRRGS